MIDPSERFTLEQSEFSQSEKMEPLDISTIHGVIYEPEYSYLAESRNINDYFQINNIQIEPSGENRTIIFFEERSNQYSEPKRKLEASRLQSSRKKIATFNHGKRAKSTLHQPIRLPLTPRFLSFQLHSENEQLCVGILRQTQNIGQAPFFNGRGTKKGILTYTVNPQKRQRSNVSRGSLNFDYNRRTLTSQDFYQPKYTIIDSKNDKNLRSLNDSSQYSNHFYFKKLGQLSSRQSERQSQSDFRDTASFLNEASSLINKLNNKDRSKRHISQKNSQTLEQQPYGSICSKRMTFAAIQNPHTSDCVELDNSKRKPGFIKTNRNESFYQRRLSPLQIAIRQRHKVPSIVRLYESKLKSQSYPKQPVKSISEIYINKRNEYKQKYQAQKSSLHFSTKQLLNPQTQSKIDLVISHLSIIFQIDHFDKKYAELMMPPNLYKTSGQFGNHLVWTGRIYLFRKATLSDYVLITVKADSLSHNSTLGRTIVSISDLLKHQQQAYYETSLKDANTKVAKVFLQFQLYKNNLNSYRQYDGNNRPQTNSKVSRKVQSKISLETTKRIKNERVKERILKKYIQDSKIQKLICPRLNPNYTRRYTGGNIKIGKAKRVTTEAIQAIPGPGEYNLPNTFSKHSSKQV